ncbi:MAG: porin [Burkholderiaceae bacterium]|nr:porin [Burkholderiaceae bacterium]
MDQAWNKVTKKSGGNTVSDVTGLASVQMGGGVLGVKGSEDLSGGLKASYTIEIQPPIDEVSAADVWNRQAFVGLSGGFGALRIGKQYSNAFMNTLGMDPGGATGLAGNNAYCVQLAYSKCSGGSDAPLRQSNGMQYDLPEMLPGLKVGLTVVFGENTTSKAGDGNGFNVSYTSGPFYAGYTFDRVKNITMSHLPVHLTRMNSPPCLPVTIWVWPKSASTTVKCLWVPNRWITPLSL